MDTPYNGLGFGKNVQLYGNANIPWGLWADNMDSVWNTYHTNPVNRDKYFQNDTNLISGVGMTGQETVDHFKKFNLNTGVTKEGKTDHLGIMSYRPSWYSKEFPNKGDEESMSNLGITSSGYNAMLPQLRDHTTGVRLPKQAVGMHEYGHLIDYLGADTSTGVKDENHGVAMSDIMDSQRGDPMFADTNWTAEEMYKAWMEDPRTAHLDVEDPTDRSHHSGRNNPREGFGKYLAAVLTDPHYQTIWDTPPDNRPVLKRNNTQESAYNREDQKYYMTNHEMFTRAQANSLNPDFQSSKEYSQGPFKEDSTYFSSIDNDLNRIYANSLATFLNSR
jgi:hypothetical protein